LLDQPAGLAYVGPEPLPEGTLEVRIFTWHQHTVACGRNLGRVSLDFVGDAPPLLDDDDRGLAFLAQDVSRERRGAWNSDRFHDFSDHANIHVNT